MYCMYFMYFMNMGILRVLSNFEWRSIGEEISGISKTVKANKDKEETRKKWLRKIKEKPVEYLLYDQEGNLIIDTTSRTHSTSFKVCKAHTSEVLPELRKGDWSPAAGSDWWNRCYCSDLEITGWIHILVGCCCCCLPCNHCSNLPCVTLASAT